MSQTNRPAMSGILFLLELAPLRCCRGFSRILSLQQISGVLRPDNVNQESIVFAMKYAFDCILKMSRKT